MLSLMVASCQSSSPDGRAHGYDEMYLSAVQQKAKDLNQAIWRGDKEAVTAFLARGSSPNERDSMGMTPLMNATIAYGDPAVRVQLIEQLIRAGADVHARVPRELDRPEGSTALMIACSMNGDSIDALGGVAEPQVVEALLRAGARVNPKDENGETALSLTHTVASFTDEQENAKRTIALLEKAAAGK